MEGHPLLVLCYNPPHKDMLSTQLKHQHCFQDNHDTHHKTLTGTCQLHKLHEIEGGVYIFKKCGIPYCEKNFVGQNFRGFANIDV